MQRYSCFFFNDTATTEIYTLSLHDALPISLHSAHKTYMQKSPSAGAADFEGIVSGRCSVITSGTLCYKQKILDAGMFADRKSTRLNSSHANISYAVFCLKKKLTIQSLTVKP